MPRNDPTDTGGLFIGRRPGTAPLRYRTEPLIKGDKRQRRDARLANLVLAVEISVCLALWGPVPVAWLWVGGRMNYWTGNVMAAIAVSFIGMILSLIAVLSVASRLDYAWRILRRAAGVNQTEGVLPRIFMWTAIFAGGAFAIWFLLINGPGSTTTPGQGA